jgi:hypothetical protein
MLSVETCRKYLGDIELTDKQVQDICDAIVGITSAVIDDLLTKNRYGN